MGRMQELTVSNLRNGSAIWTDNYQCLNEIQSLARFAQFLKAPVPLEDALTPSSSQANIESTIYTYMKK